MHDLSASHTSILFLFLVESMLINSTTKIPQVCIYEDKVNKNIQGNFLSFTQMSLTKSIVFLQYFAVAMYFCGSYSKLYVQGRQLCGHTTYISYSTHVSSQCLT